LGIKLKFVHLSFRWSKNAKRRGIGQTPRRSTFSAPAKEADEPIKLYARCVTCTIFITSPTPKVDVALAGAQSIYQVSHRYSAEGKIKIARCVSGGHWQSRTNFDTRTEGWSRV
jgi:hypothetical protein